MSPLQCVWSTHARNRNPRSDDGYDYDALASDTSGLLDQLDPSDVTLVGFSMGGGEVARYVPMFGEERLHSVVFASAVPPYLKTDDNPARPLTEEPYRELRSGLEEDRDAFFDEFTTHFYSVDGELKVDEAEPDGGNRRAPRPTAAGRSGIVAI